MRWFFVQSRSIQSWIRAQDSDAAVAIATKAYQEAYNLDISRDYNISPAFGAPNKRIATQDEVYSNVWWEGQN